MNRSTKLLLGAAIALVGAGAAQAQQATDNVWCRAGTMTVLAQEEKTIVWALDHRGVAQATDLKNPFHGATQRCIGVVASIDGKSSGNGWCKIIEPQSGNWLVVDWAGSDKPGHGTWNYRYGSGKFKGVTGGGTYEPIDMAPTKAVDPGTYQNCTRVKGTMKLPG
jgi:hypothetical protein